MASTRKKPKGPVANVVELVVTVAIAIGLALLIQAFLVKPYRIPSGSMIPTLSIGQRILVNRLDTHPGLGDIVVFHPPTGAVTGDGVCGNPTQGAGQDSHATRAFRQSPARPSSSASSDCPETVCRSATATSTATA